MAFTPLNVTIAIMIIVLVILIAYLAGASRTKQEINMALRFAGQTKTTFKVFGKHYKLVHQADYQDLVKRAEQVNPVWDWATVNGKER